MSLHGSQRRPLVCEIEDLHWCAHTSEDYLAGLVESITGAAVLLLVTHRPGYRPPWTEQGFPLWRAHSSMLRGWALAHQEQAKEGSE
jgi:hypothetical protein